MPAKGRKQGRFWWFLGAAAIAWSVSAALAQQENVPPPPANENAPQQNREAGRERNMTPEERRAEMERRIAERLKQQGFTDEDIAALKQFNQEREAAQRALNEAFRSLVQTARMTGATDDQARLAVAQYREAMKTYEAALEASRKKLDERIHYSTRPKVEAILLSLGVLDNGLGFGIGIGLRGGFGARGERPGQGQAPRGRPADRGGNAPAAERPAAPMN